MSNGKAGTSLKATLSYRLPIYAYMEFLIQKKGLPEDAALELIQEIFNKNKGKHSNKPNLGRCKKDFRNKWGNSTLKKGLLVEELPQTPPPP
jgi:hypothetical protein